MHYRMWLFIQLIQLALILVGLVVIYKILYGFGLLVLLFERQTQRWEKSFQSIPAVQAFRNRFVTAAGRPRSTG